LTSIREDLVRAEIHGFHSPDVDDLAAFRPQASFSVLVQLLVGPVGGDGEESFELVVCSPDWLAGQIARVGRIAGAHHLIVNDWAWHEIADLCARRVAALEGPSWRTVAQSLNQFAAWEFDDYDG
jgi:Immunity protein 8